MNSTDSNSDSPSSDIPWIDEVDEVSPGKRVRILIEETDDSICYHGALHKWVLPQLDSNYIRNGSDQSHTGLVIEIEKIMIPNKRKDTVGYLFIRDVIGYFHCSESDTPDNTEIGDSPSIHQTGSRKSKDYSPQSIGKERMQRESITDPDKMSDIDPSKF